MPPSLPASRFVDEPGWYARVWLSTWTGDVTRPEWYPQLMSVSFLPPSVDFQMSIASKKSASGLLGSTASAMSYHICGVSSPHGPAVVVPSGKLSVEWFATCVHVVLPSDVRHNPRKQPRDVVAPSSCNAPQVGC